MLLGKNLLEKKSSSTIEKIQIKDISNQILRSNNITNATQKIFNKQIFFLK